MAKKPGVMIYFEVRACLSQMSTEEKGQLFEAILAYGEDGVLPDFTGGLQIAWSFIQQRIDFDQKKYEAKCERARSAREVKDLLSDHRSSRMSF